MFSYKITTTLVTCILSIFSAVSLYAHCQIPCGIYDDYARVVSLLEDVTTVKKSMNMMHELTNKKDIQSRNQFVRWVVNKEQHAEKIISKMNSYFLTQRVKPTQKDYAVRLQKHHAVILAAMEAKQSTDLKVVENLEKKVQALKVYYKEHKH